MSGFGINQWVLSGNLTKDPELRTTQSGTSVCSMRIAYNHRYFDKQANDWTEQVNYFDVIIWGGLGENAAKKLAKGKKAVFAGRAQWREWTDKNDNSRQSVELVADSFVGPEEYVGSGGNRDFGPEPGGGRFAPQSDIPADTGDLAPPGGGSDFQPVPGTDDDIPF